jgi:tRNA nucleotidyltransferase (CCA-adding enzyme)
MNYGCFIDVLRAAADLKSFSLIDYEGYYKARESETKKFSEPLIVIDPVDENRNVASALRRDRLIEFVAASRQFLKNPSQKYFYPRETKPLIWKRILKKIQNRGSTLILLRFGNIKAVSDVLWGQLYRTQVSLRRLLEQNGFHVLRSSAWSDEQDLTALVFEIEHGNLSLVKKHLGPPIEKKVECDNFLQKHVDSTNILSGPYLESGRWIVEIKRKHNAINTFLWEVLKDGGKKIGVAELISQAFKKNLNICINDQIKESYSSNIQFAKFLTEFIKAKPKWLD